MLSRIAGCLLTASLVSLPLSAAAQSYPSKPIRMVLGYSTGGTSDTLGRMISEKLGAALGQSVLIDNRPGASGNIAAQIVAKAAPDGYTLLYGNTGEMAINPHLMKDMGFDPLADFVPVVLIHDVPLGFIVSTQSPYTSFGNFLDAAKREPGKLVFASSGNGTPAHLAIELLTSKAGVKFVHVPYKGAAPALLDLLGGRVDAYFLGLPGVAPHVKSGKVRLLAVSTAQRAGSAPDTPTVAEHGFPGFSISLWGGLYAPAGTPADIVSRVNREVLQVITQPDITAQMAAQGSDVVRTTPQEFGRFAQNELKKYGEIVKGSGLKLE